MSCIAGRFNDRVSLVYIIMAVTRRVFLVYRDWHDFAMSYRGVGSGTSDNKEPEIGTTSLLWTLFYRIPKELGIILPLREGQPFYGQGGVLVLDCPLFGGIYTIE